MKYFETLEQCKAHYVNKVDKYISCGEFGHIDGMDGACWWCKEMTPYQFEMCSDASWLKSLMNGGMTEEEAIKFIEDRKQKDYLINSFKECKDILYNILDKPSSAKAAGEAMKELFDKVSSSDFDEKSYKNEF